MKPNRIILVRHGQSEGNVNKAIYREKPDYAVHLTELGRKQSHDVGKKLNQLIGPYERVKFYVSPMWRTRETALEIKKWFMQRQLDKMYEDPRLREQELGLQGGKSFTVGFEKERDDYGNFYWQFPGGESAADVYDRISDFLNTLWRDFQKDNFPENVIIVTHGTAMRIFLMRWFHYSVEKFESIKNPKNCGTFIIEKESDGEHYWLKTELGVHNVKHPYQFPEYKPLPKD